METGSVLKKVRRGCIKYYDVCRETARIEG